MEDNEALLVSVKKAAQLLNVSIPSLYRMERDGRLKPVVLGHGAQRRTLRYSMESLREFARGDHE